MSRNHAGPCLAKWACSSIPIGSAAFASKAKSGLVALIELASLHDGGGVMQAGEIASRQGIPERYLEQMLTSLRRGGILRSIRGPKGGYQLVRQPGELLVSEVVHCLEGEHAGRSDPARQSPEFKVLHALAGEVNQSRARLLEGTTLLQLIERRDSMRQAPAMYFI
jgi:Rrf2 family protein